MRYLFTFLKVVLLFAGLAACNTDSASPTAAEPADAGNASAQGADGAESSESLSPAPTPAPISTGLSRRNIVVDEIQRSYYLYAPEDFPDRERLPVVLVFHGSNQDGSYMASVTGFNTLADTEGFLAVYPDGTGGAEGLSWNAGPCCGYAFKNGINEPAFVRAILADLEQWADLDSQRIYATGFSNGALLTYRLGCEMADTLAAVAPVAGTLVFEECRPSHPVSLLHIHGSADIAIPFTGGATGQYDWPPAEQGIADWAAFDGCGKGPLSKEDGVAAHTYYTGCAGGTGVDLYLVQDIGHRWPADVLWPATQTIWEFFAVHPKA